MKNILIKSRILVIVIITIVLVASVITIEAIISIKNLSAENVSSYKLKAYEDRKSALENYVQIALKTIETYHIRSNKSNIEKEVQSYIDEQSDFLFSIINEQYETYKNKVPEDELKELISNTVSSTRYAKSGYFWINDFNYKLIMHPIKKELDGKVFKNDKDVPFVQLGVDALKNKESAYIQYTFYSPSSKKTVEKASIVKVFKPFNWIIGTGAYIDDLSSKKQKWQSQV